MIVHSNLSETDSEETVREVEFGCMPTCTVQYILLNGNQQCFLCIFIRLSIQMTQTEKWQLHFFFHLDVRFRVKIL